MKFLKSAHHALRGIMSVLRTESNFRWQFLALLIVVMAGVFFEVTVPEWVALFLTMALVLSLEIINTAIEKILDMVKPRLDDRVALIKDIMAGAVLIVSLAALLVGLFIFLPYVGLWLGSMI